jgi:hypothetical protein
MTVRELAAIPLSTTLSNPFHSFAPFLPEEGPRCASSQEANEEGPRCASSQEAKANLDSCKLLSAVGVFQPTRAKEIVKLLSGVGRFPGTIEDDYADSRNLVTTATQNRICFMSIQSFLPEV